MTDTEPETRRRPIPTSVLTLRFPAKPEYLVLGRLALTGLSRAEPIEEDTLRDLKLALTEACTNSVRHAYPDVRGAIEVRYELSEGLLAVEVEDNGAGFDPDFSDQHLDPDALDEGGLGLAIIRAVSDEFELRPRDGGNGSCLRFALRLRSAETTVDGESR
jgi:serine/threonine-protein kinase RsbW